MVQVDMGFLPYFDLPEGYHFGGHVVVVCGYDPETRQVLIADRDEELYPVSMEDLEKARGSTHKPFPPKHKWWTFDFADKRWPTPEEVRLAIYEAARGMLEPPFGNLGVKGIRKAAKMLLKWPEKLGEEGLRRALFEAYVFIEVAGTGGGIFRYMYSRFLREAAEITGDTQLNESAIECASGSAGRRWLSSSSRRPRRKPPFPLCPSLGPRCSNWLSWRKRRGLDYRGSLAGSENPGARGKPSQGREHGHHSRAGPGRSQERRG